MSAASDIFSIFANSYDGGQKIRPDLPTTYQASEPVNTGGWSFGGQSAGETAADLPALTPYTQEQADAYIKSDILSNLTSLQDSGAGEAGLNAYLSSSTYSPQQFAAATGYHLSDVEAKLAAARMGSNLSPDYGFSSGGGGSLAPVTPQPLPAGGSGGGFTVGGQSTGSLTPAPGPQGGLSQLVQPAPPLASKGVDTPPDLPTILPVSYDQIQSWFTANPNWTPETLKSYMASNGISPEQVARFTGLSPEEMIRRYNLTGRQPVQPGAQTAYVEYYQPLAPLAQGAGSGNAPYYYSTPAGQVASYLPPAYWRGNLPAYGGTHPYAEGGEVKSSASQDWLRAKCNG